MISQSQNAFIGVDAQSPLHLVADDEVATATNIDFSYSRGAATARRGSTLHYNTGISSPVRLIFRSYNNPHSISSTPTYYALDNGVVLRQLGTAITTLASTSTASFVAVNNYRNNTFISAHGGASKIKDDGTNTTLWFKTTPSTPTITLSTSTGLSLGTSWTITEGTGSVASGTLTASTTGTNYRITAVITPTSTNLSTNGSFAIGDYGIDYMDIKFTNPAYVESCSRDYSIDGTSFTNYYHTELDIEFNENPNALTDADLLLDSEEVDSETRAKMAEDLRQNIRPPLTRISAAADTFNTWAVPRPNFEFVGKYSSTSGSSGWGNIPAARIIVEGNAPFTITIANWEVRGSVGYPLNDVNVGYAWWQTWAKIDSNGVVLEESAPSAASSRYKCQYANATIAIGAGTATNHGITHAIVYRQGGYMKDAYAIGTASVSNGYTATTTATVTDTITDIQALASNKRLTWNIRESTTIPNNIVTISAPFYNRLFMGAENKIYWSLSGQPDSFPQTSFTEVSHTGDEVQALHVMNNSLVIVNRDSVYELYGSVFEGAQANWQLTRSGARHGSKAAKSCISTPYGIVLLDYDGLFLYQPGSGQDQLLDWAMARIGDAFLGAGTTDPADIKRGRIPAINKSYINRSCAAFANDKLYLAVPSNANQHPDIVFVIDFLSKRVWWYRYATNITYLFWDFIDNTLYAGSDIGGIFKLETGVTDRDETNAVFGIEWTFKTKVWTAPTDIVLENISVECEGTPIFMAAEVDGALATSATFTNTLRDWNVNRISNTSFANSLAFAFSGTQTSTDIHQVHNISWEGIVHPRRVKYLRTDHQLNGYDGEKIWDTQIIDIEMGVQNGGTGTTTVLATSMIDNIPVMTSTLVGTDADRQVHYKSYPVDTVGDVAYTIYTIAGTNANHYFKLWKESFQTRNEPVRMSTFKTDVQSLEEQLFEGMDVDINPNGTVTSTVYIDNVLISTTTFTGTNRQSYTVSVPPNLYGRTVFAIHNGSGFKHYQTWFHMRPEPDRWFTYTTPYQSAPSSNHLKTWVTELDPLGSTVVGAVYCDNFVVATATFTGSGRQTFNVGLDVDSNMTLLEGTNLFARYTASSPTGRFKHYTTQFETVPQPFTKNTWAIVYQKIGGASAIDMGRFFELEIDCEDPSATITSVWDVDGTAVQTNTFYLSGHSLQARIPFQPGIRGYLWQQRLLSTSPIRVVRCTLDLIQTGRKNVSTRSILGTPR